MAPNPAGLSAKQAFPQQPAVEEVVWREVAHAAMALGYTRHGYVETQSQHAPTDVHVPRALATLSTANPSANH